MNLFAYPTNPYQTNPTIAAKRGSCVCVKVHDVSETADLSIGQCSEGFFVRKLSNAEVQCQTGEKTAD